MMLLALGLKSVFSEARDDVDSRSTILKDYVSFTSRETHMWLSWMINGLLHGIPTDCILVKSDNKQANNCRLGLEIS